MRPDARAALFFPLTQVAWLAAVALVAVFPALAYTPGQAAYKEGELAYQAGKYAVSVEKLNVAIQEDPLEGLARFRFKGLNQEDYFPHFYLGQSLKALGRGDEALRSLRESKRQGAIAQRAALIRLLDRSILALEAEAPRAPSPTPKVVAPVEEPTAVPPMALAPATPKAVVSTAAPPTPTPVPATRRKDATPSPVTPTAPSPEPEASADPVPIAREGLRLYLKGDYEGAARILEGIREKSALARLFLSYALAGSYLEGGGKVPATLERARAEHKLARAAGIREAREEDLSPSIRALFKER